MPDTRRGVVLRMDGKPVNWENKQTPTAMVQWSRETMYGRPVTGSLRTICHIDRLNNLSLAKFDAPFVIIQPPNNKGVEASEGTHDFDACFDWYIPGVPWWTMQKFGRWNGLADWYRPDGPLWSNHQHGFTLPPQRGTVRGNDFQNGGYKVGVYIDGGYSLYGKKVASSQLEDYYQHKTGLKGHYHDPSPFPPNIGATIFDLRAYIERRRAA